MAMTGGMLQFYSGSGQGTLRANIMNANNAGVHFAVGGSSVVFTQNSYVAANALDDYEEGTVYAIFCWRYHRLKLWRPEWNLCKNRSACILCD